MTSWYSLLVVLVVVQCYSEQAEAVQWIYTCRSGVCIKSEATRARQRVNEFSLNACRLTCGTFGAVWPIPTGVTSIGSTTVGFVPRNLSFTREGGDAQFIDSATRLFNEGILNECLDRKCDATDIDTQVLVHLKTQSSNTQLDWDTVESYSLKITTDTSGDNNIVSVVISATTVYGTRHGLETLSQLMTAVKPNYLILVRDVDISDGPVYPHRGLSLDTARNFMPITAIKRQLDGMAATKMNVLHWHATDSQSFPLAVSSLRPQLAEYGAYSTEQIYLAEDVIELMSYARVRGVRIVLEIDAPAHSGNGWQFGPASSLGNLAVCVNQQPWRKYCIQPPCGQLNPSNPAMYQVLGDLYRELVAIFPVNSTWHLGGDEVFVPCWNNTREVTDWMDSRGWLQHSQEDFLAVWAEFLSKVLASLDESVGHNETQVVVWSSHLTDPDVVEKYLDKERFVIETWVEADKTLTTDLLALGYRVIVATKDAWYLDHGFWGITKYHGWKVAYDNLLPLDKKVLGGETALWSELIDQHSLDSRVWPRTAAAAERLWSNPTTSSRAAETRLLQLRDRLISRGLAPEAIVPGWCGQNQRECD